MNIRALWRLVVFMVVAGFFAVMELTTLTGPHTGTTDSYSAVFTGPDGVSGLRTGNPVRVAGVAVGKVSDIQLVDAEHAKVTFSANRNQQLTSHTWAVVRYANLLGQRYLALTQSSPGGTRLAAHGTIPQQRTAPALSLTDLFNGFRPLFTGLTPQEVNQLAQDLIDVLQGQGDRIDDLIARTADLTGNLADRDSTFATVVDSLTKLLATVAKHDDQLAQVVTTLQGLTQALHQDGKGILDSVAGTDQLIGSVGGLFAKLEDHSLPADVSDAASLAKLLAGNTDTVTNLISGFASAFQTFARVSQNGNWINVYACNVFIKTYGTVQVSVGQVLGSLNGFAAQVPGLGALIGGILSGLGAPALGTLLGNANLPVPLALPNGQVGGDTSHTEVCS